jgi:hypothetical protein
MPKNATQKRGAISLYLWYGTLSLTLRHYKSTVVFSLVRNKTNALTNLTVIDKVDGLLGDPVAPAVVAEYLVGDGDRAPALQVRHLLPSARRPLAAQANQTPLQIHANL